VLDIRSDGTVAYVTYPPTAKAASCRGTLFVLAPGTAPRTLASGVCQLAKLAADEVVAKRKTRLVAIPLSGTEHTLVNLGQVAVVAADAQNTKVGYAIPTCAATPPSASPTWPRTRTTRAWLPARSGSRAAAATWRPTAASA
jgi:hypothetical protein